MTHLRLHTSLCLLVASAALAACSSSSGGSSASDAGNDARADGAKDTGAKDGQGDTRGDVAKDAPVDVKLNPDAGPPSLVELEVTGAKGALTPAFSPTTHDYYVLCSGADGGNDLTVTLKASDGSTSQLVQPTPASASAPSQTVQVDVKENEAIVATATNGVETVDYWVRCLPHDFSQFSWKTFPDAGTAAPGYYLVGNASLGATPYAFILDSNGVPVWYQQTTTAIDDVDSLQDNTVSYIPAIFPASTQYLPFVFDHLEAGTQTTLPPTGFDPDAHELVLLPNGHYLMLADILKTGVDLTGLSYPLPRDAGAIDYGPDSTIQDCEVLEVDPATGAVVWTWAASDHFDPRTASVHPEPGLGPNAKLPNDGGTAVAVFWCTSVDVDPTNGNLLVGAREMDSVFYIDRSTDAGTVLWKLGGADSSKDHATYIPLPDAGAFHMQHDGRLWGWKPSCGGKGGAGQVSVFDDETGMEGRMPRGVLYDVAVGPDGGCSDAGFPDGSVGQASVAWQFEGTGSAAAAGSMRLEDGGTRLIGWGFSGYGGFTEVDEAGHKLVQLDFTDGMTLSYRALKVPLERFDLSVLRATAGKAP